MTFSKTVNLTEKEKVTVAKFYGRVAYFVETGEDLPLEAFNAEKTDTDKYTITLKEGNK